MNIYEISPEQAPISLLLEADPSEAKVRQYLAQSKCYVGEESDNVIAVYVLFPLNKSCFELMNIAVLPEYQAKGIGTSLLKHAISSAKKLGAKKLVVGTGTFGYQLAFYQKAGFRVRSVERDFFLKNYPEPIFESGIQHKDRLRLDIEF